MLDAGAIPASSTNLWGRNRLDNVLYDIWTIHQERCKNQKINAEYNFALAA